MTFTFDIAHPLHVRATDEQPSLAVHESDQTHDVGSWSKADGLDVSW